MRVIYPLRIWRQTVKDLRHLHEQYTHVAFKGSFNMSFGAKTEQRTFIFFCVELGKSPMEIKQLLEKTQSGISVSRAVVYQTVFRRIFSPNKLKDYLRHTVITESLTLNVLNSLQHRAWQTVRGIVLWNSIAVASTHYILTEHIYRISGFSVV